MKRTSRKSSGRDGNKPSGPTPDSDKLTPQQRIEQIILSIPPGRVSSYGQVADLAGLPGRARLVARVLRVTERELPWFRVLRSSGQIAIDPDSPWFVEQIQRLRADGIVVSNARVDLRRYGWTGASADLLALEMFGVAFSDDAT